MGNNNIKNNYVEATVMNMYATIQLHPPYGFWEEDFLFYFIYLFILFFFLENLAFWLPWPPIKISDIDKIHMVGRRLPQKHFCKTFVKISAVTQK